MLTIQEINTAIISQTWTNDQLTSMQDAVIYARTQLRKQKIRTITIGAPVEFTSSKTGRTMQGTVTKIAIKFVTVKVPLLGSWRVPANMLTVTEKELA
jgi:hypothetical protein